jgi:hypothetical protein
MESAPSEDAQSERPRNAMPADDVWSAHIMPQVSVLRETSDAVVLIRLPFLKDTRRVISPKDQRLSQQAWLRLSAQFERFWRASYHSVCSCKGLPVGAAREQILRPRIHLLEERYATSQSKALHVYATQDAHTRFPPPWWCVGDINRVPRWLLVPIAEQLNLVTEALLAQTEMDLSRACAAAESAFVTLLEADIKSMETARVSYLAMNPVVVEKPSKRARDYTPPSAPNKLRKCHTLPKLRQMITKAQNESLFDQECAALCDRQI